MTATITPALAAKAAAYADAAAQIGDDTVTFEDDGHLVTVVLLDPPANDRAITRFELRILLQLPIQHISTCKN